MKVYYYKDNHWNVMTLTAKTMGKPSRDTIKPKKTVLIFFTFIDILSWIIARVGQKF